VLKGVPAQDLQRAVRVVADGGAWLDPAVTARVLATYRSATPPAARPDPGSILNSLDALTGRERQVLVLIGRGRTNGEIAAELFVSEGTVKTHINHVFTKLCLRDRAAAVVFAFDHDLVTRELAEPVGGGDGHFCVSARVTIAAAVGQPFVKPKNGPKSRVPVKPGR
jgi:DNA-binding NarL/FixJ family response regulator